MTSVQPGMRRLLIGLAAVALLATGCHARALGIGHPSQSCSPPAGGRCAADVAWPGQIMVAPGGRVLHGVIICGGELHVASQTAHRVVVRLHVDAMGAGSMSCARVDVMTHLAAPLDHRPVYDAVSGARLAVVVGAECRGLALRCTS